MEVSFDLDGVIHITRHYQARCDRIRMYSSPRWREWFETRVVAAVPTCLRCLAEACR